MKLDLTLLAARLAGPSLLLALGRSWRFREVDSAAEPVASRYRAGAGIYACRMAADMMSLEEDDLVDEVDEILGAMEFLEMSEDAQMLFI